MTDDVTRLHAHEMAARLRAGDVSARDLAVAHREGAERQNHALNAWLAFNDGALDEADAADARLAVARGEGKAALDALHPLLGIPVALKDLVSVKGGQATAGSRILEGYVAPYDAHITEQLRAVGAVILGKTNMDEFAMGSSTEHSAYGPTANPWDLDTVPGGSSGGSAVAVAAYPRSARHRHGHGWVDPEAAGSAQRDRGHEAHLRARLALWPGGVRELARPDRAIRARCTGRGRAAPRGGRRDERDSTSAPVPVPEELLQLPDDDERRPRRSRASAWASHASTSLSGMDPDAERRMREAVRALEAAGALVEDVSLPHTDYGLATYYIVAPAEASANLARYDGIRYGPRLGDGDVLANYLATRGQGFGAEVKRRIMLGTYALSAGYYDAYYLKAQKVRTLIKHDFDALWAAGFDAIVAPTSPSVAFRFGARLADPVSMYLSDACTLPVNMAGLPGVSIPCGLSEGLPVGLQLIGAPWSEASLFRLARGYEASHLRRRLAGAGAHPARSPTHPAAPTPAAGGAAPRHGSPCMSTTHDQAPLAERVLSQRVMDVPPSGIRRFFDILATMDDVISLGVGEPDFDTPEHIVQAGIDSLWPRSDPLHVQLRHHRAPAGPVGAPRQAVRASLRPGHRAPHHGRRVRGGRPRPARDLRPGRRGHPPRAVVRRVRAGDRRSRRRRRSATLRRASRTTSRSTRRRSRRPSRRGPRPCSLGYPCNPTGAVLPDDVQDELAAIAVRHDLLVYSDEIYDRLAYGSYRHRAMSALPGMRERTILMGGFSKAYAMTGWRVGYVAGPRRSSGDGQGPPVRDHVGADDGPGRGARRGGRGRGGRRADAGRVRPPAAAPRRRAQRPRPRDLRAARRLLRLPADRLDRARRRDVRRAAPGRGARRGRAGSAFGPSGAGHVRMCYATSYERSRRRSGGSAGSWRGNRVATDGRQLGGALPLPAPGRARRSGPPRSPRSRADRR